MNAFVFASDCLPRLRGALLAAKPKEAAALLFAARAGAPCGMRLLVREAVPVPPDAYTVQEADRLEVAPRFIAPLLKRARDEGWSLLFAHTHPFGGHVRFSRADDEGERLLMPSFFGRAANRPHGALVLGPEGFDARLWCGPNEAEPVGRLLEAGRDVRLHLRDERAPALGLEFDRSVRALGAAGQAVLRSLTVGVVGLGGMGSVVVEQLAYLGVGRLVLLDPDKVEVSNLNRLVGGVPEDVGRPKVEVAAEHVRRIRPDVAVEALRGSILFRQDARPLLSAHFLIGCTDSHGSRAVLNQLAYQYLLPTIDTGLTVSAVQGKVTAVAGRVQMLAPGLPCLVCQGLLDPERVRRDLLTDEERARDPYITGAEEPQPAVISLNGTVASLAVTMLLAAVAGFPSPARHQVYLADRGVVRTAEAAGDPRCVVCSLRGALGRGDLWPMPWRS